MADGDKVEALEGVENPFKSLADNTLEPASEIQVSSIDSKPEIGRVIPARNGGYLQPDFNRGKTIKRPASPTAKVRDAMREGLVAVLPALFEAVKKGKVNQLQFADFLAKYSIGTTGTIALISPDVIRRLEAQVHLIASRETWQSHELLEELREIWA